MHLTFKDQTPDHFATVAPTRWVRFQIKYLYFATCFVTGGREICFHEYFALCQLLNIRPQWNPGSYLPCHWCGIAGSRASLMLLLLHSPLWWVKKRTSLQFSALFVILWKTWGKGKSESSDLSKVAYCKRFTVSLEFVVSTDKDVNRRNDILNIFNY